MSSNGNGNAPGGNGRIHLPHPGSGGRIPLTEEQVNDAGRRVRMAIYEMQLAHLDRIRSRSGTQQHQHRVQESTNTPWEWIGGVADFWDRFRGGRDGDFAFPISTAVDRRYGANWPFWRTWNEHARIRGQARICHTMNQLAGGALTGLTSFVIGEGFRYHPVPRPGVNNVPRLLLQAIQACIDEFSEENEWPEREQEIFRRSRRDGECFTRRFVQQDGMVYVRTVEPEWVMEPPNNDPDTTSFGVFNKRYDLESRTAFWVASDGFTSNGEEVSSSDIDHIKCNVDGIIKRGLSDFSFDTYETFRRTNRLLENMQEGGAIQAAIAFVRKHTAATPDQIAGFAAGMADYEQTNSVTGQRESVERFLPGTILDIDGNQEFGESPFAANVSGFVELVQAGLRSVAVRWNAPEWIVSADSSNSNYASSLVAEAPFVRTCRRRQAKYRVHFLQTIRAVVKAKCDSGRLFVLGRRWSWREINALVKIDAVLPTLEARDKNAEASRYSTLIDSGVISRQIAAEEQNIDYERVIHDAAEYNRLGEQAPGQQPKPQPTPLAEIKGLSGLQAITSLQGQYYGGQLPRAAAVAALRVLTGLPQIQAEALFPDTPPDAPQPPDQQQGGGGGGGGGEQEQSQDDPLAALGIPGFGSDQDAEQQPGQPQEQVEPESQPEAPAEAPAEDASFSLSDILGGEEPEQQTAEEERPPALSLALRGSVNLSRVSRVFGLLEDATVAEARKAALIINGKQAELVRLFEKGYTGRKEIQGKHGVYHRCYADGKPTKCQNLAAEHGGSRHHDTHDWLHQAKQSEHGLRREHGDELHKRLSAMTLGEIRELKKKLGVKGSVGPKQKLVSMITGKLFSMMGGKLTPVEEPKPDTTVSPPTETPPSETVASTPSAKKRAGDLPANVRSALSSALHDLRRYEQSRRKAVADTEVETGKDKGSVDETAADSVDRTNADKAKVILDNFREMAVKNGFDPDHVIAELGGIPEDGVEAIKREIAAKHAAQKKPVSVPQPVASYEPATTPVSHPLLDILASSPSPALAVWKLTPEDRYKLGVHLNFTSNPGLLDRLHKGESAIPWLVAAAIARKPGLQAEIAAKRAKDAEPERLWNQAYDERITHKAATEQGKEFGKKMAKLLENPAIEAKVLDDALIYGNVKSMVRADMMHVADAMGAKFEPTATKAEIRAAINYVVERKSVDQALAAGLRVPDNVLARHKFTGKDALGREWVNGELVRKQDEPSIDTAGKSDQTKEPAVKLQGLEAVPDAVKNHVIRQLDTLRQAVEDLNHGRRADKQFNGDGRYEWEHWQKIRGRVKDAKNNLEKFRKLAADNNVDADAVIAAAGGLPEVPPLSKSAAQWETEHDATTVPKSKPAPVPATEPEKQEIKPTSSSGESGAGVQSKSLDDAIASASRFGKLPGFNSSVLADGSTIEKLDNLAKVDTSVLDDVYNHPKRAGSITHNEYLRSLYNAVRDYEHSDKSDTAKEFLAEKLGKTYQRIRDGLIPGLRQMEGSGVRVESIYGGNVPLGKVADFYEQHALPILKSVAQDHGVELQSGEEYANAAKFGKVAGFDPSSLASAESTLTKLKRLSGMDTATLDDVYKHSQKAGSITHNEYLRTLHNAVQDFERSDKSATAKAAMAEKLNRTRDRIKNGLIPGLRQMHQNGVKVASTTGGNVPLDRVADFYEQHALPILDAVAKEYKVAGSSPSGKTAPRQADPTEWAKAVKAADTMGANLVPVHELRKQFPDLSDDEFKTYLQDLHQRGVLSMSAIEGRHAVSPDLRKYALPDGDTGRLLGYVSLRN